MITDLEGYNVCSTEFEIKILSYNNWGIEIPFIVGHSKNIDPSKESRVLVSLHSCHRNPLSWEKVVECGVEESKRWLQCIDDPQIVILHPSGFGNSIFLGVGEKDVFFSLKKLKDIYSVDDSNIFVSGFSMGGAGALRLLCKYPLVFKAGASVGGYCISPIHWTGPFREKVNSAYEHSLKGIDIIHNKQRFNGQNIYISHGEKDFGVGGGVPFEQFLKIKEAISSTTCNLKWNVIKNIGHAEFPISERRAILSWFQDLKECHINDGRRRENLTQDNAFILNPIKFIYLSQANNSIQQKQLAISDSRFYLELNSGISCGPFRNGQLLWGGCSASDSEIRLDNLDNTNIVLYGSSAENDLINAISDFLPATEHNEYFYFKNKKWSWNTHAARFIISNPYSKNSQIAVNLGRDYGILSKGFGVWYGLTSNFIIFDSSEIVLHG
jgi:predicted esterase